MKVTTNAPGCRAEALRAMASETARERETRENRETRVLEEVKRRCRLYYHSSLERD